MLPSACVRVRSGMRTGVLAPAARIPQRQQWRFDALIAPRQGNHPPTEDLIRERMRERGGGVGHTRFSSFGNSALYRSPAEIKKDKGERSIDVFLGNSGGVFPRKASTQNC